MKRSHRAWLVLVIGIVGFIGTPPARCDLDASSASGGENRHLAFLSPADRQHLLKVRREVMRDDSALKTEQDSLQKEREFVKNKGASATADDRKMLMQNFKAHNQNMRDAMLKADPSIAPVLDQVAAKMKEQMQDRRGGDDPDQ